MLGLESFGVRGILRVYELHGVNSLLAADDLAAAVLDGAAVKAVETHNLVVNQGLEAIAKFLGNNLGAPSVGGSTFSTLEDITVGAMDLGSTVSPTAPANADTASVGTLVYSPPIVVTYPTPYAVKFSGLVPITEANGVTFTEEALKLRNGKVFAKATFSKAKTSAYALQFDHTITFTRV